MVYILLVSLFFVSCSNNDNKINNINENNLNQTIEKTTKPNNAFENYINRTVSQVDKAKKAVDSYEKSANEHLNVNGN